MDEFSRRNMLRVGGAFGAMGALAAASPARARTVWDRSPQGSAAAADPEGVWDPEADPLLADLLEHGEVPRVNELIRTWTRNGQPLPKGLPAQLRDFLERARELPSWADRRKLSAAAEFNRKQGDLLGVVYGFASGMISTVIPHEARAVYYSKGGAELEVRIAKTARLGYDVSQGNAFEPEGGLIVSCVKTRLVHAAVRHLLPRSPHWKQHSDQRIPISQRDLLVTWHSLPTTIMRKLTEWKVSIPGTESQGYLHSWQLTGHLLGILDEHLPTSWDQADAQAKRILDPLLAPTSEGTDLAHRLLRLGADIDGGVLTEPVLGSLTRYVLGERIADWLRIDRQPFWDGVFDTFWEPFVAFQQGVEQFPGAAWLTEFFTELIRKAALFYLGEGKPIVIDIPQHNRPG
ncbi:oxygenase MpaB family protein [Sciscionella marina]|uniref:oxygenase MpaB family protein n=1 Tax=Sciscionella marina TaxID=508770 RepID=UPI00037FF41C|nr:oxygenase MpaB family protein [Sciscionella marina]